MECNSMSFINTHTNTYTTKYEALTENENTIPGVELVKLTIIYKKGQLLAGFSLPPSSQQPVPGFHFIIYQLAAFHPNKHKNKPTRDACFPYSS